MSMLLVFIVLCTAIVGFFSQEFSRGIKRIFSIPGAKLFIPFFCISFIVERYVPWVWKGLSFISHSLAQLAIFISSLFPFKTGALALSEVLILGLLAGIPLWVAAYITWKKHLSNATYWASCVSAYIWIASVILLISHVQLI